MSSGAGWVRVPTVRGTGRRPFPAPLGILAALLLLVALAAPAAGASGPTALRDPSASPDSGVPTTTITLSVTYENREGSPPDYVRAVVNGSRLAMHPTSASESWRKGVRYVVAVKLPAGSHAVRFEAMDREKFTDAIAGPTITIKAPPPTPTPEPTATPKPTPKPTATPKPQPTSTPAPTATPAPTDRATAAPTPAPGDDDPGAGPSSAPTSDPGATPSVAPWPIAPGDAGASPEGSPSASPGPSATPPLGAALPIPNAGGPGGTGGTGNASGRGGSGGSGGDPYGGPAALFGGGPSLGPSDPVTTLMRVIPVAVATTGGVTMVMAFLVFGKRRRDQEPTAPDAVLAQRAAMGSGFVPDGSLVPAAALAAPAVAVAAPAATGPVSPDAHMPRWRRPSLLEARKADPTRTVTTSVRLTFDAGVAAAAPDAERRLIRYRLVSLLDAPDEVNGREIAVLDQGDEVVLLEKRGTFWRVLCPDGSQGWLHKMTLGDVVIDSSVSAGESWTSGDEGPTGFEDVLRAYRERRGDLPAF